MRLADGCVVSGGVALIDVSERARTIALVLLERWRALVSWLGPSRVGTRRPGLLTRAGVGVGYRKSLPVSAYTKGTKGTIAAILQVSFAISPRSLRNARLIQISTTAIGCRMYRRSSRTFFIAASASLVDLDAAYRRSASEPARHRRGVQLTNARRERRAPRQDRPLHSHSPRPPPRTIISRAARRLAGSSSGPERSRTPTRSRRGCRRGEVLAGRPSTRRRDPRWVAVKDKSEVCDDPAQGPARSALG